MEAAEALINDPQLPMDGMDEDNPECSPIDGEDSEMTAPYDDSNEASMADETESARIEGDAVMEHTGTADDDSAMPALSRIETASPDQVMADNDEESTCDTLPMYDELSPDATTVEVARTATNDSITEAAAISTMDSEMKEDSPLTEGDNSQSIPDGSAADLSGLLTTGNLPALYPHCYVCGFDRETMFIKEKKAPSGPHRNRVIYRNRCVRKGCYRYFGPSYIWDGTILEYVKISEETASASRPFSGGPREKKFADVDYDRACQSGVRPAMENMLIGRNNGKKGSSSNLAGEGASPAGGGPAAGASTSAARKPRKGYQWVAEPIEPETPQVDHVLEFARMLEAQKAAERMIEEVKKSKRAASTQTGHEEQVLLQVAEDMRKRATFKGLRPSEEVPLAGSISNRLFMTQRILKKQTKEISDLRSERDTLREAVEKFTEMIGGFRKEAIVDMQRLKEDVMEAGKELTTFSAEMKNEATKDLNELKKIKAKMASRVEDLERINAKTMANLKYQVNATAEAESIGTSYYRNKLELEHKMTFVKLQAEDAKNKLNDKIYLTNNARCTHCQVNENIKKMLTEQITDKTLSEKSLSKERADLARKLENSERIAQIVTKENAKLKFELKAWETNCHRMKDELKAMRGHNGGLVILPHSSSFSSSSSSSHPSASTPSHPPGEAAFTPQSSTSTVKDAEDESPERMGDDLSEDPERPPVCNSVSSEEGEYKSPSPHTLAKLPPPPAPPPPSKLLQSTREKEEREKVDSAFAHWIPKEPRSQEMPREMAEAMRRVEEALEKGGKEKKRSGAPLHLPKNGEKKARMEGERRKEKEERKEEKRKGQQPPPGLLQSSRPIPKLSGSGGGSQQMQQQQQQKQAAAAAAKEKEREREKRKEEERRKREPSPSAPPVPYSSSHEPAFPAVVAKKGGAVKVPYNGPSSLASTTASSPHTGKTPEKKPYVPPPHAAAASIQPAAPRDVRPGLADAIIREEYERSLRELEMQRRERERAAMRRPDPYYDAHPRIPSLMGGGGGSSRYDFNDDELPWNAGGGGGASGYQNGGGRPRTPIQEWHQDDFGSPPRHHDPRMAAAPGQRFYDDVTYDPHAPRDQYGRLAPDFGLRQQQAGSGALRAPLAGHHPPGHHPHLQQPGPHDQWRREWHEQPWSDEPHQRRSFW